MNTRHWCCAVTGVASFLGLIPSEMPREIEACIRNDDGSHNNCGWATPLGVIMKRARIR